MKIKIFIINICLFIFVIFNSMSDQIEFESSNMDIKNNGNIIFAYDVNADIPNKGIYISSDKAVYDKLKNIITFEDNVFYNNKKNQISIEGKKIIYERDKELIYSIGNAQINLSKKYIINSKDIFYDSISNHIYSDRKTLINDFQGNKFELIEKFKFHILNEIIESGRSVILDRNDNKYIFENLKINLKNNEIVGKEIKVEFEDGYFGNKNNDPKVRGRSGYSNDDELKVYKAVFSTCNIENKKCRGWELNSNEFNHDKKKKIFEYKNSWLKIFNVKLFYLPYFNHPDPSVKRKSGFLTPSYSTSDSLGTSVNIPYFKVLGVDKDITFNPRYYADKSFLLQNEYRQNLQKSKILTDFSFLVGEAGTKGHFFYNQLGQLNDNLNFEINLQNVEGDNYFKNHKLKDTSSLISNDNLLLSNLDLNWTFSDSTLNTSFKIFEDLSRNRRDRYQYIYPDFNFTKNIEIPNDYNGQFDFNSYGYNKNYNTNIYESVLTNDFLFASNQYVNKRGFVSEYDLLLKNSNSYSSKSTTFKENSNYELFGTIKTDFSLPLKKNLANHVHYLKPILSLRYSPNVNSDISSKDVLLNYNNAFSLNRIGTSHEVEGGESLTAGIEFKRHNIDGLNIFDIKVANVMRIKENNKLPLKTKLNKKRSDIFGNLNYKPTENLKLGYFFSYDKDLKYSNLEQVNIDYSVNNFLNTFSYYTEDNDLGSKENIKNTSSLKFNKENTLSFEMAKDLKDDFTQFYNLVYTYETDCISLNLNYNKTFFRDGNLEPNKSLSFLIKIIPFTELGVPNVGSLIKN